MNPETEKSLRDFDIRESLMKALSNHPHDGYVVVGVRDIRWLLNQHDEKTRMTERLKYAAEYLDEMKQDFVR